MAFKFNPFTGTLDIADAGSGLSGNSFVVIQTDFGTSPIATNPVDSLSLTSSDSTVLITGDSGTDTIDFQVTGATGTPFSQTYYNASGNLDEIPSWSIDPITGGPVDVLTYIPNNTSQKIHFHELEISSVTDEPSSNISMMSLDSHIDRNGNGGDFGVLNTLNLSTTIEGIGDVGQITSINQFISAGTGSNVGISGDVYGINQGLGIGAGYTSGNIFAVNLSGELNATAEANNYFNLNIGPNLFGTLNSYIGLNLSANVTGSINFFSSAEMNPQIDGPSLQNMRGINISPNFGNTVATSVDSYIGYNLNPIFRANATLNNGYIGFWDGGIFQPGSIATNGYTGFLGTPQIDGPSMTNMQGFNYAGNFGNTTATSIDNYNEFSSSSQFRANFTSENVNSFNAGNNFDSGSVVDHYTGFNQFVNLNGTHETFNGMRINGSGNLSESAQGLDINMSGFTVTPSVNNPTGRKSALGINEGSINSNLSFTTVSNVPNVVDFGNIFNTQFLVSSGSPITGTEVFNNAFVGALYALDDYSPGALGLGWSCSGAVGQIATVTGKTVDAANMYSAGFSVPDVGQGAGGTITDMHIFRVLGAFSAGGSQTITNIYGFRADAGLSALAPVNTWGISIEDPSADNFFSKSVIIGGPTKQPTNSDIGLEIASTKVFLNARLTTAERNALIPIGGMQLYNTDTGKLEYYDDVGLTWVSL